MMLLVRLLPVRRQYEGRQGDPANFPSGTMASSNWYSCTDPFKPLMLGEGLFEVNRPSHFDGRLMA